MTQSPDSDEFLQEQYSLVRSEIETRITSRRRLIAAGIAFGTALVGYAFTSGTNAKSNVWLIALLPVLMFYLGWEILRTERLIRQSAHYLREIEDHFLDNAQECGWETRLESYRRTGFDFKNGVIIILTTAYIAASVSGWYFWRFAPPLLDPLSPKSLAVVYVLMAAGLGAGYLMIRPYKSGDESGDPTDDP